MRDIKYVVLHHSVTPRDLNIDKSLKSFDNNHYERLTKKYGQPLSWISDTPNIAYHFCIAWTGEVRQTRLIGNVGYHASNLEINKHWIGICLTGNFDEETPSKLQYEALNNLLETLSKKYHFKIMLHNQVKWVNKTCPWKNFDLDKVFDPCMTESEKLFKLGSSKNESNRYNNPEDFVKDFVNLFEADKQKDAKDIAYKLLIGFNTRPKGYPRQK